jgi:serine/threonine protein kinase
VEQVHHLLLLSHLFKLGLVSREAAARLEDRVRAGLANDQLRDVLTRDYALDRATLDVLWASVSSSLAAPQHRTRVERRRGRAPAEGARVQPRTAVEAKLRALEAGSGADAEPTPFTPPDLSLRYTFLEIVGVGGMGVIHLARDNALKRRVAIKTLRPEFRSEPRWIKSLLYEAVITGNLEHPSIIPIYDLGLLPTGELFYSMKYLEGPSLRDVIDRAGSERGAEGQGPEARLFERILLFRQICSGVDYAHARGVVHRDLKPSNISVGSHGEVAIMDWGISRGVVGDWPRWNDGVDGDRVIGTFEYSAPEQVLDENAEPGPGGDVYSLGVILYELLTLRLPYGPYESAAQVAERTRVPPPLPSAVAPERVRAGVLDGVCLRALHAAPDKRYRSVREIIDEIDAFIAGTRERQYLEQLSRQEQESADGLMRDYVALLGERSSIRASLTEMRKQVNLFVSEDIRQQMGRLDNRLKNIDVLAGQRYSEILTHLNRAHGYTPDSARVLRAMFRLYRARLEEARAQFDLDNTIYYGNLALQAARRLNDETATQGARLSIRSYPEGAEISVASYSEVKRDVRFEDGRPLGKTPLMDQSIAPGSYLIMARKPGFLDEHRFQLALGGETAHLLVTLSPLSIALGKGGRERELHDMELLFGDAVGQERVKLVVLEGTPGAGILHIANSFKDFLERLEYFVAFISVDCRGVHAQVPFYVVGDMIKFRSGIRYGESRADVRKRLHDMLLVPLTREGQAPAPREAQEQVPLLVDLLGALPSIDLPASPLTAALRRDPTALRGEIMRALTVYFEWLAEWVPVVVILHNAQWADPSSLEFLSTLRRESRGKPIVVIGIVEESDGQLPAAWHDAAVDSRIRLRPLEHEAMERTIAKLLNGAPSLELVQFLIDRSGGLPYVTEHLIARLIRERKLYQRRTDGEWVNKKTVEHVPRYSLDMVLEEQIAELTPPELQHLRAAAVVGRIFWKEALAAVLDGFDPGALLSLIKRRFLHEHAHSRFPSTEEYAFTVNAMRDRVYEKIPADERREWHGRVARWLWLKYRGAIEEVSLLGHHYERSGDTPEAGIFFQRVGDTCRRYDALDEALANYRRVLGLKVDAQRAADVRGAVAEIEAELARRNPS